MNKNLLYTLIILYVSTLIGCGPKESRDITPEEIKEGITLDPTEVDADKPLTITFKAPTGSPLYGYTGKVYAHMGLTETEGSSAWFQVPAEWNQNLDKMEMKPVSGQKNCWQIRLIPSVRQFFGVRSNEPIPFIALVIRSADGQKKGLAKDYFIPISGQQITHQPTPQKALPSGMKLGINHHDNGKVTFVLDDLDKSGKGYDAAYILGSFNQWKRLPEYQMNRDPQTKWLWLTLDNLEKGKEYAMIYALYSTNSIVRTSDPYSEKVQWGIAEARSAATIFSPTPRAPYPWKYSSTYAAADKANLIIYEMHLRDFTPEGNLSGARKRLDYIQSMGFNAIELMPIQEFDGDDSWGYNPNHLFAMDQAYGTDQEYKEFIDECHRRGMAVILDIVYNHASSESPFFKLYNSNGKPSATNPWMNTQAPHPYSVFHDFNHEEPRVREYFKRNLQYLLTEYKVDGFRFDLTKGLTQKRSSESTAGQYDTSRINILKDYAHTIWDIKPNAYVIFEHFCEDREELELANEGAMLWRNLNHQYCQSGMGWQEQSAFDRLFTAEKRDGWVGYMESHDEERVAYKQITYGVSAIKTSAKLRRERLETNAAFFFMVPGAKMVWQFGEVAYDHSINENGRTGRKPIYTESQFKEIERENLMKTYSKLIKLRHQYSEFWALDAPFTWQVSERDWNNLRTINLTSGDKQIKVFGNFNPELSITPSIPQGTWYNLMDTESLEISPEIKLLPGQFLIIGNFPHH